MPLKLRQVVHQAALGLLAGSAMGSAMLGAAQAQSLAAPSAGVVQEIAPGGVLRAAINYGNPVLAQKGSDGEPAGVSVALAQELARRLGVKLNLIIFQSAGDVTSALGGAQSWDMAFLAIDPKRAETIAYSAPYVNIEGAYMVRAGSPIKSNDEVDKPGVRIAVGRNSAYDLYLSRELKNAQRVFAHTTPAAVDLFMNENLEVCASVKLVLESFARGRSDVRVLPGRFMVINQAVALPKGRNAALQYVHDFVEEMKATGFIARELQRSGQQDAAVAPQAVAPKAGG